MARYRLHYFPESGNSYKLALMLRLCGEGFEPVWTDFAAGVTRTPQWRAEVNAMGEIPVLMEDGRALTQTAPILLHLAERFGRFGATDEAERFAMLRWLFWDNHKLSGYLAPYRFYRAFTADPNEAVQSWLRRRIDDTLSVLENHLAVHPFAAGERATVADISMVGYMSFPPDEAGIDYAATHPAIAAWLRRVAALPGWSAPYDLLPGKRMPRRNDEPVTA